MNDNVRNTVVDVEARGVEVMLWRAALALGATEAQADEALVAVWRYTGRPEGASESRLLRVVIDAVAGVSGREVAPGVALARLVEGAGVPDDIAAHALGMDDAAVRSAHAGARESELDELRERVGRSDAAAALVRVDFLTTALRRRRMAVNALKYAAFFFVLGLIVYVMFDLREAARLEKEKLTPGDIYSLPMPKGK